MKNLEYLFAAYTIIWIVLFIYMFSISARVKEVKKELDALQDNGDD